MQVALSVVTAPRHAAHACPCCAEGLDVLCPLPQPTTLFLLASTTSPTSASLSPPQNTDPSDWSTSDSDEEEENEAKQLEEEDEDEEEEEGSFKYLSR